MYTYIAILCQGLFSTKHAQKSTDQAHAYRASVRPQIRNRHHSAQGLPSAATSLKPKRASD